MVEDIAGKDPGAIMIIMSDHGFKNYSNRQLYEPLNFDNICAIRYPGKTLLPFPGIILSITVNLFPIVPCVEFLITSNWGTCSESSIVMRY
ncbi:MAG: hypothetical protein IPL50_13200 [Chitinophagaceae bacterium]|nr:hypothetical protein [Chitinophagaceae bacterium]